MTETMRKEYAKLRRRPFLTPVWLTVAVAALALAVAAWAVVSASTTTIFVMRHAEKATEPADDPPLSLAGELRAGRLAQVFGAATPGTAIDGILVSEFRRSHETARPLAAALGIPVVVVKGGTPRDVARRALAEFGGRHVLIIGHSNTVPGIVQALSGQSVPPMGDADYGTVYVIARPHFSRASVTAIRLP